MPSAGARARCSTLGTLAPQIFILALAITLSSREKEPSQVFALVFTEAGAGAVILTWNVILLGAR